MSMFHKAFVFEYDAFFHELHQILIDSLIKNNPRLLIDFIDSHRQEIRDPYEGLPLQQSWQDLIEVEDIQEYADFAVNYQALTLSGRVLASYPEPSEVVDFLRPLLLCLTV